MRAPAEIMRGNGSFFGMSKFVPSLRSLQHLCTQSTPRASFVLGTLRGGFLTNTCPLTTYVVLKIIKPDLPEFQEAKSEVSTD